MHRAIEGRRKFPQAVACIAACIVAAPVAEAQAPPPPAHSTAQPEPPPSAPNAPPPNDAPPNDSEAARKEEARVFFEKGVKLYKEGLWDAALAEFSRSRELVPTRAATANAAVCLRKLNRFDEALEMNEALLRDFKDLSPDVKAKTQRELVELQGLVGTIVIEGAPAGAAISIDRQNRGEYPLTAPLRVVAGSHVIAIYKKGLEPFEELVEVAGGKSVTVKARLPALLRSGRLKIVEELGRKLDVLVDGSQVGATPFEGPLAPGEHIIVLRGEDNLGTLPTPVSVDLNGTTALTLRAEHLRAELRITPTPANAMVAVDSILVGRGTWQGRLRDGKHRIEVAAPGFLAAAQEVVLEEGRLQAVPITLERDPASPFWRVPPRPARFTIEIGGAFAVGSTLDAAGEACDKICSRGAGLGGFVGAQAGYELGSRFGFGVTAGYLSAVQSTSDRLSTLNPVGLPPNTGRTQEETSIRGVLVGVFGGLSFFERFPLRLRMSAGVLFGRASATRSGAFTGRSGAEYEVGPVVEAHDARFLVLGPEARVGLPLGKGFELYAGLEVPMLFALSRPQWSATHAVPAAGDGYATFNGTPITAPMVVLVTPGAGARYEF